ncbi:MAG: SUF system NifU family Fe-S cluster assembly protein [Candidatus Delongbacteria bacterium]|nr:SUF system NifU family Fe-S cluster assembly protein [Candidatus Delongbacteria bacterium]MBN2834923.1 SUF system NifU family Fe-S cluster assembly protein [Candidatus Delongbacteria bacterium]
MSSDLNRLYQDMILDHNKNPRNFGKLEKFTHYARGKNPLCGDDYEIFVNVEDEIIKEVSFEGIGCAISKSSASLLTAAVKGKNISDAVLMKDYFIDLLTSDAPDCDSDKCRTYLGKLKIFEGVKQYPVRVKCATLIWRAFESALSGNLEDTTN